MRNKVKLFIGTRQADLDDASFILLNYTQEELTNPTIVRNSFSRQITLKGTPANDAIFGFIHRNDRLTQYSAGNEDGIYFDPTRKTSFVLYNDTNEIIESGYIKLDSIEQTRRKRSYKVTLYGGLGSFLYGISYKSNGDKMTLADLNFGEDLGFTINRTTVAAAWQSLADDDQSGKWTIINFAPCYNGKPSKPFDSNKGIVHAQTAGLPERDGDYSAFNGLSLVTLDSEVTEQEAKDYRSYLQRPVLRLKNVIQAICNSANNGGWTVNVDPEFYDSDGAHFYYWSKTWITLPQLTDLNIDETSSTYSKLASIGTDMTVTDGGNLSKMYSIRLRYVMDEVGGTNGQRYVLHCEDDWAAGSPTNDNPGYYLNYLEFTVTLKDSNDATIKTIVYRVSTMQAPEGYTQMDEVFDYIEKGTAWFKNGNWFDPTFEFQEYGVSKVYVDMQVKAMSWGNLRAAGDPSLMWPENSYDFTEGESVTIYADPDNSSHTGTVVSSSTVRTGATVTQAQLLSGDHSPADYLLSFCKMFGFQMLVHKDAKVVDLLLRKNFYTSTVTDLSGRIERSKGITKIPYTFDAMWYLFGNEAEGEYAEYYENKYGRPYGQYRVNTGYEFDASEKSLTDGIIFQNGCDVVETSKFFCNVSVYGDPIPAVFLGGGKYTLYKGGETKDYDLPQLPAAAKSWVNSSYPMHDKFPLMQFHGSDNGHLDGRDVLLFFDGMYNTPAHTTLSDDTRPMLALNANNPCWMPGWCDYENGWTLSSIPRFGRYLFNGTTVTDSVDWGNPAEVQIPWATLSASAPLFPNYWEKYIADRYDDDSAVVTAYVDLRGFQVNENLFRQFYAFDGAIWSLNRIIDHSLTTSGPTRCEFVKVQDTTNYTSY